MSKAFVFASLEEAKKYVARATVAARLENAAIIAADAKAAGLKGLDFLYASYGRNANGVRRDTFRAFCRFFDRKEYTFDLSKLFAEIGNDSEGEVSGKATLAGIAVAAKALLAPGKHLAARPVPFVGTYSDAAISLRRKPRATTSNKRATKVETEVETEENAA